MTSEAKTGLKVYVDLAIVVRRECGCFAKFYYELDAKVGTKHVDQDYDFCPANHRQEFLGDAQKAALEEADKIRRKV